MTGEGKFHHDLGSESSSPWGKAAQEPWGEDGLPPASRFPEGVELCPVSSWKELWQELRVAAAVPTRTCSELFRGADQQLWWYVLSSQVLLFMAATGCSCSLLTLLVCFLFPAKPFLATWALFYRLLSETEPFACQLLMTTCLSFSPCFSKASRHSPNSLPSSLPLPLSLPYSVWAAVNTQLLDGLAVWADSLAGWEVNKRLLVIQICNNFCKILFTVLHPRASSHS